VDDFKLVRAIKCHPEGQPANPATPEVQYSSKTALWQQTAGKRDASNGDAGDAAWVIMGELG